MDTETKNTAIKLYRSGHSLRSVASQIGYGRERIRLVLKESGTMLRGLGANYKMPVNFSSDESALFAEFLGYLYGDGSLCKGKSNDFQCVLVFSLDEEDLVERVKFITHELFEFIPTVQKEKDKYRIGFKRTLAKYLYKIGYPVGKKSACNPHMPSIVKKEEITKRHFICGFLNAEAGIHESLSVQQSVRVVLDLSTTRKLKTVAREYLLKGKTKHFVRWSAAKDIIPEKDVKRSHMLIDLQKTLAEFGIKSQIYPVRVYIGNNVGLHYELRISSQDLIKIKRFNMLTGKKKQKKLNQILQE